MDTEFFNTTPLRQHTVPGTEHRGSTASIVSTQSGNSFPTYGLIKVSNSDHGSSCDSFSLVSPQGSAYLNNNTDFRGSPARRQSSGAISQSKTLNPFHDDYDTEPKTPKTPLSAATATFGPILEPAETATNHAPRPLSLRLPFDEEAKGLRIPEKPFERVRYFLDRTMASYHSEQGAFLTDRFFINREIFLQSSHGVPNGSVKIGIIQEITSLLKKFVEGDESTSLGGVEATLHYYQKLMDAFDVFATTSEDPMSDQTSVITGAISPRRIQRIDSRDHLLKPTDVPQHPHPQTQHPHSPHRPPTVERTGSHDKKKANRNSFVDKFKGKIKRRSMLSLDQNFIQTSSHQLLNSKSREQLQERHMSNPIKSPTTHTRSISVSTSNSSRSMRDVCQLPEYMSLLESLHNATDEAFEKFGPEVHKDEALEKVVNFMDSQVIVFIMRDVSQLALSFMKKTIGDYC